MVALLPPLPITDEQLAQEMAHEEAMFIRGRDAYRQRIAKMRQKGTEDQADYSTQLLRRAVLPVAEALRKYVDDAGKKPGQRAAASRFLREVDLDVAALLTTRNILSTISRPRSVQSIAIQIGRAINDEVLFSAFEDHEDGRLFRATLDLIDKNPQKTLPHVPRSIAKHAMKKFGVAYRAWSKAECLQVGTTLLHTFITVTGFVHMHKVKVGHKRWQWQIDAAPELREWIEEYTARSELFQPHKLPTLVPPRDWTSTTGGGYYHPRFKQPLIHGGSHRDGVLQEMKAAAPTTVYTAINILQRTPRCVNTRLLAVADLAWERGLHFKKFPRKYERPKRQRPADYGTNKQARIEFKKLAGAEYKLNLKERNRRYQISQIIGAAHLMKEHPQFYFTYFLDTRGRTYTDQQLFTPQGVDLAKGLLLFGKKKRLGASGMRWLAIHVANMFGQDKITLDERVSWTKANSWKIGECAADPMSNRWWTGADKPWQFLAACFEWANAALHGEDYETALCVCADGSNNGLQHFAAMLRDEETGRLVNLTVEGKPQDIYGTVAGGVMELLDKEAKAGRSQFWKAPKPETSGRKNCKVKRHRKPKRKAKREPITAEQMSVWARLWYDYGITRSITKRPVMVLPYSGTREAVRQYTLSYVLDAAEQKSASESFGDGRPSVVHDSHPFGKQLHDAVSYLSSVIWHVMQKQLWRSCAAMKYLQVLTDALAAEGHVLSWVTDAGLPVIQRETESNLLNVRTKLGDVRFQLRIAEPSDRLDPRRIKQSVSPNLVHSRDAATLHLTVTGCYSSELDCFSVVHDEYGTHPSDMDAMLAELKRVFIKMYDGVNVLRQLYDKAMSLLSPEAQLKLPLPPEQGKLNVRDVERSLYFFA